MLTGKSETRTASAITAIAKAPPERLERFLRIGEVSAMSSLRKTTIYKYMSSPEHNFPSPVPLGGNRVAWLESEVLNWMRERVAARQS